MNTMKLPFYARLAFILISLILIILILEQGHGIFVPLVFGLFIAITLFPVARFLERRLHMSRGAAAMLSISSFLGLAGAVFYFLAIQVAAFASDLPNLKVRFQHTYDDIHHWLTYKMHINNAQQNDYINRSASSMLESAAHSVSGVFMSLTGMLILIVFVFIFSFFILYHRTMLMNVCIKLFSDDHKEKVREVIMETRGMINSYIVGLLLEMVIMSIANSVLLLALGVDYAILLGVLAAVLNVIPYLGIYSATAIIVFLTFANSSLNLALEVGAGLLILHMIDSNILMPRIVGARVKMNAFITVLAVIVGEYIWGIAGMFLFIPLVAMLKLIFERIEGLEAWAMLIGVDDTIKTPKKKVKLPKK